MVWTTFNPVEAIPWVAGKIVVHGISYPVDDDYPVDNMSYPVGALLQLYPVDAIPWVTYTVDAIPWVTYTVDVSRGQHVTHDCYPRDMFMSPTGYTHSIRS